MSAEIRDPHHQPSLEDATNKEFEIVDLPEGEFEESDDDRMWVSLARNAYTSSDDWFNASVRKQIERALSNFQSKHPQGSKYHSPFYEKRSRLFRPKTRSMVRGTEAAAAVAFFSTSDAVDCKPFNDADPKQELAAQIHNALLNHRLAQPEMHWFITVMGAIQEANTVGVVVSKQSWEYESEIIELGGRPVEIVKKDKPRVDLLPLENFRISPSANWMDPINTTPYTVELKPMYVYEVKERMMKVGANGQPIYRTIPDMLLGAATKQDWDTIRKVRTGQQRMDAYEATALVRDYDTVWVHHNIVHKDGQDWVFDTIGNEIMLSAEAQPIHEVYHTGKRPYVMGFSVVETHRIYPSSPVMLTESLQEEANDLVNLRIDNVRLALGKRYFVRRGAGVDTNSLIRNVASSVTMMTNPQQDVKEMETRDVTGSAYQEQDRINLDFDELAGRFSQSSVGTNRQLNETVGGMNLMASDANQMQEYQIRVVAETWLEPVLRQLVDLESVYESDHELLAMIGGAFKLEVEQVVALLRERVSVTVNVGFNATNPEKRIERLTLGLGALAQFFPQAVQGGDVKEIAKEIFGALGYKDVSRFIPALADGAEDDPRIANLEQQIQELQQMLQGKVMEQQTRLQVAQIGSETQMAVAKMRAEVEMMKAQAGQNLEMYLVQMKNRLEEIDRAIAVEDADIRRRELYLQREALSHSILEADRNFQLKLAGVGKPKDGDLGTKDLAGEDKAGTIGRSQYGAIPHAGG